VGSIRGYAGAINGACTTANWRDALHARQTLFSEKVMGNVKLFLRHVMFTHEFDQATTPQTLHITVAFFHTIISPEQTHKLSFIT
jgi:hypothetical protein